MISRHHTTIEITPSTSASEGPTAWWWRLNTVCSAYSGLVPMSPKTTPSAPSEAAASGVLERGMPRWSRW